MKIVLLRLMTALVCACGMSATTISKARCDDGETTKGESARLADLEFAARDGHFDRGCLWPSAEKLANAHKWEQSRSVAFYERWFNRVLNENVQPEDGRWNADGWLVVPELYGPKDQLIGHFSSQDQRIFRIEFQKREDSHTVALTLVSDELLPNKEYGDEEIRELFGSLLSIPANALSNLEVDSRSLTVGKGTVLTIGRVLDARHKVPASAAVPATLSAPPGGPSAAPPPRDGLAYKHVIPDPKREWLSPMRFWIAEGRL